VPGAEFGGLELSTTLWEAFGDGSTGVTSTKVVPTNTTGSCGGCAIDQTAFREVLRGAESADESQAQGRAAAREIRWAAGDGRSARGQFNGVRVVSLTTACKRGYSSPFFFAHCHRKLTEIYLILEVEDEGAAFMELDGERIPVRPQTTILIGAPVAHLPLFAQAVLPRSPSTRPGFSALSVKPTLGFEPFSDTVLTQGQQTPHQPGCWRR
jgi:hypothetical protein